MRTNKRSKLEPYLCYAIVEKQAKDKWAARVLNLDDCTATGKSKAEVVKELMAACQAHCDKVADMGKVIPLTPPSPRPASMTDDMHLGFYVYFDRDRAWNAAMSLQAG